MMGEEDDAVTSNAINNNDDCTTNIPSCSGSDNNRIGDGNCDINQISQVWGTLEELLLTCAVERHGSRDWDSVAKEVGSRTSLDASALNCRLKYQDLKRRFEDSVDDDGNENSEAVAEEDRDGDIPWLEKLRSLRMAELRREIQRRDDSILSRQLKVKKLTEEREGNNGENKPDLEDDAKTVRSPTRINRETTESDHRSMNESNSTTSVDKIADHERLGGDKMAHVNEISRTSDPDPAHKATAAVEEEEVTDSKRSDMSHSGELGESGTSTGHRKRKGQIYRSGEDSCIHGGSGGDIKSPGNKSEPLIEIVKLIRSHPRGSVFETRLRSQETKDYKSLIKQHMDIKTVEKKMEKGSYVSSSVSFYRDLKLLFTNAIVFFPTSSSESMAAQELRALVSNEMKKETGSHRVVKTEPESSGSRQKPSAPPPPPLVVCKKKSVASKKTVTSSTSLKQKDEKKTEEVSEEKKTVTTASRSSRRTSNVAKTGRTKNNNKKQKSDDDDEEETHKKEKLASEKKKSVAEFLKRIKKNSPQKGKELTTSKDQKKKSDGNVKKETKPRELRSNSTGKKKAEVEDKGNKSSSKRKQTKKETEEVTGAATTTGSKRGRESVGKDSQQPKKRSRR